MYKEDILQLTKLSKLTVSELCHYFPCDYTKLHISFKEMLIYDKEIIRK